MPESYRLYLDQMFGLEIARALRGQGHDVLEANRMIEAVYRSARENRPVRLSEI